MQDEFDEPTPQRRPRITFEEDWDVRYWREFRVRPDQVQHEGDGGSMTPPQRIRAARFQ